MRTFFLDDDKQRIRKAHSKIAGHFIAALTADAAIEHLQSLTEAYDLICLDHDLTGVFCPSDEQSGYAVAQVVAALPDALLPQIVVVHSYNYDAQRTPPLGGIGNMMAALAPLQERGVRAIAAPFDLPEFWDAVDLNTA